MNTSLQHFAITLVQVILQDFTTFAPTISFPTFLFNILFSTPSSASLNTTLLYDMSLLQTFLRHGFAHFLKRDSDVTQYCARWNTP